MTNHKDLDWIWYEKMNIAFILHEMSPGTATLDVNDARTQYTVTTEPDKGKTHVHHPAGQPMQIDVTRSASQCVPSPRRWYKRDAKFEAECLISNLRKAGEETND